MDSHGFFVWLRESCLSSLLAQMKGERLMLVTKTSDGFRAKESALRSLDGGRDVSFHSFSLQEDRCVQLLLKNFSKRMPGESFGRSWRPWTFMFRASCSSALAAAIRMKPKTAPRHRTS
jgi:hypothetical protein